MTTLLTVLAIFFLWLIFDFVIVAIAGKNDKLDALMDNTLMMWTVMLPLSLITMAALFVIQFLGKK